MFNPHTPVCSRLVCADLTADNTQYGFVEMLGYPFGFNRIFLLISFPLVMFFAVEFTLKIVGMRDARRFFFSGSNWFEFICVLISVYELAYVTANFTITMD